MTNAVLIDAAEVAQILDVSKAFAYKVVRELNEELKNKGFITIAGKVIRKYFAEKFYGLAKEGT
ncbi:MAG: DNA-binding protein [Oscillospiraceae bacterium]